MPEKTKADLERELKTSLQLLKDIVDCFTCDENTDDFNSLSLDPRITNNLDTDLDAAREFLK